MHVTVGSDTYGRIKTVGGTPIVTKFVMLQFLPIYPLQSFYLTGLIHTERRGIPLIASSHSTVINGIPLARVDRLSVVIAYLRGIFGAMTVVGFMSIIPLSMYFTGEHLDAFALSALRGLLTSFVVGLVGGVATYLIPRTSVR